MIYTATSTNGNISVSERNLNQVCGKSTSYSKVENESTVITNYLYNVNGKVVASTEVEEHRAFFSRNGEVKTALDKNTCRDNLSGNLAVVISGIAEIETPIVERSQCCILF